MTEAAKPRRPGRPVKEDAVRRRPSFTFRAPEQLRRLLEEAGAASGRSVSEEIEHRLERSFEQSKMIDEIIEFTLRSLFSSTYTREMAQRVAMAINNVERATGKRWTDDYLTKWEAKEAAQEVISRLLKTDKAPVEQDYDLPGKGRLTRFGRSMGRMVAEQADLPTVTATGRDNRDRSIRLDEHELRTLIEGAVRNAMEQARRDVERE